ncbi:formyltransferase family protein [Rhodococcus sp. NPDC055112]
MARRSSPLPKYAGLAPFYWMAEAGETEGGVSAIRMNEALDDGPIVARQLLRLSGNETERAIRDSHFEASWRLFDLVLPTLIDRTYRTVEQSSAERTYFGRPPATPVSADAARAEASHV